MSTRRPRGTLPWLVLAIPVVVGLFNAWVTEDAFITFRTIDNFVRGYGLTWNPGERVQVYTHPLWMWVLTAAYAVTDEAFNTTLLVCALCTLSVYLLIARALRREHARSWGLRLLLFVVVAVSSKAFVDYSSSGLENPLSHLLALAVIATFPTSPNALDRRRVFTVVLLTALAFTTRMDAVLVSAPATGIVCAMWLSRELSGSSARAPVAHLVRALSPIALGLLPAVAWLGFSTIYYGFPFPNTAYAKLDGVALGASHALLHPNAVGYFTNSLRWDPATLPAIAVSFVVLARATFRRDWRALAALAGSCIYMVYILKIGGDYMSGRFFSLPFVVALGSAVLTAPPSPIGAQRRVALALAAAAPLLALMGPRPPFTRGLSYRLLPKDPTTIRDERGYYHEEFSLLNQRRVVHHPGLRDNPVADRLKAARPKVINWGGVGHFGFIHGPDMVVVDHVALCDPLLARLPSLHGEAVWGRGHLLRTIPPGHLTSYETGHEMITDPGVARFDERVRNVTRGPLWRWDRARDIFDLNTGRAGAPAPR